MKNKQKEIRCTNMNEYLLCLQFAEDNNVEYSQNRDFLKWNTTISLPTICFIISIPICGFCFRCKQIHLSLFHGKTFNLAKRMLENAINHKDLTIDYFKIYKKIFSNIVL